MTYQYDPESWKWLIGEFCDVLKMFAHTNDVGPGVILRKNATGTAIRRKLVKHLHENYRQTVGGVIRFMRSTDEEFARTQKLSTTTIGRLLGMDHSTIVMMNKREIEATT